MVTGIGQQIRKATHFHLKISEPVFTVEFASPNGVVGTSGVDSFTAQAIWLPIDHLCRRMNDPIGLSCARIEHVDRKFLFRLT